MKYYIIQYNYSNKYVVVVDEESPINVVVHNFQTDKLCYEIIHVKPIKVFIGKSCLNEMTFFQELEMTRIGMVIQFFFN